LRGWVNLFEHSTAKKFRNSLLFRSTDFFDGRRDLLFDFSRLIW